MKICDFGFADKIDGLVECRGEGTQGYSAPEIYAHAPIDGIKADIFSIGVILYLIMFNAAPFISAKRSENDPYFKLLRIENGSKFFRLHPVTKEVFEKGDISEDL